MSRPNKPNKAKSTNLHLGKEARRLLLLARVEQDKSMNAIVEELILRYLGGQASGAPFAPASDGLRVMDTPLSVTSAPEGQSSVPKPLTALQKAKLDPVMPDPKITIEELVRALKDMKGASQSEVARRLNYVPKTVSDWKCKKPFRIPDHNQHLVKAVLEDFRNEVKEFGRVKKTPTEKLPGPVKHKKPRKPTGQE